MSVDLVTELAKRLSLPLELLIFDAAGKSVEALNLRNRSVDLGHAKIKRLNPLESGPLELLRLALLFAITALAEIIGCYLPWLVLKQGKSLWLLLPAAVSLALFAWLLTLHPSAAGRTYAAYGGMYIAVALVWLRFVDGIPLTRWDLLGAVIALVGMAVIVMQPSTP